MSTQRMRTSRSGGRKHKGRKRIRQEELAFRSWGGSRKGAGRKPKGERAGVPHVSRPVHAKRFPLLVTSRLRPGLHSLRHEREAECIRRALTAANRAEAAEQPRPAPFQVVHYTIQSNHLHLIVEAHDRPALTAGMRGLLARIARALNRLWRRRGPVFADRFHEHELHTAREVRNALVYVLQNLRKHGIALAGPDPLSSGPEFDGWSTGSAGPSRSPADHSRFGGHRAVAAGQPVRCGTNAGACAAGGSAPPGIASLVQAARAEVPRANTWLLSTGWTRHGLIDPREAPRPREI